MTSKKLNVQNDLHKALKKGNIKLAAKALEGGAFVRLDTQTAAEAQLVANERQELWQFAIEAPTDDSIRWLVDQDASFLGPVFAHPRHLAYIVANGSPATLAWAGTHLLPVMTTQQPFCLSDLNNYWGLAFGRHDDAGLAWLLKEHLNPPVVNKGQYPALLEVMNRDSRWQVEPMSLVSRLQLLVDHGYRATPDGDKQPVLGVWIDRYETWATDTVSPIRAKYEQAGPLVWDILVKAGADPNALDDTGRPLWHKIEHTALGQRHLASLRQTTANEQSPDPVLRRRRLRS